MTGFGTDMPDMVLAFFHKNKNVLTNYVEANILISTTSGIQHFFASQTEADALLQQVLPDRAALSTPDRRAYGDFQTPSGLASSTVEYAQHKCPGIEFVLEPTCGKGNFILAAIRQIKSLKKIIGIEIYLPYVWETKFNILAYFLSRSEASKPETDIIHANAFAFSFQELAQSTRHLKTLIVGNPPWVTNAELGTMGSGNLPKKSNFKKYNGCEAVTGKGNFDIGESIAATLLRSFQHHHGAFAFLIKNAVVKNLMQDQRRSRCRIGGCEKLAIDAKKEFNAAVEASLFFACLNAGPHYACRAHDFYSREYSATFGWHQGRFVGSVEEYEKASMIEGKSPWVWRSGIKHDCAAIMELRQADGRLVNGRGEAVQLEDDLMYGLLKSADLKEKQVSHFRKLTIITQNKPGQPTDYIKAKCPLTYRYLIAHKDFFKKRKSAI